MPTPAPLGFSGPTATTSPTSHNELNINTTVTSAPQFPTTLSLQARPFPRPRRAPRELLPSVDDYAPAAVSYAMVSTTPTTYLPSTSLSVLDTRALVAPRRHDRGTASSPTSVAEVIQPQCFPAKQKPGKYKIELCRNYDKPGGCPFGSSCTYAHGRHELRAKPLLFRDREGNLNANWFRGFPCADQVSGGAW